MASIAFSQYRFYNGMWSDWSSSVSYYGGYCNNGSTDYHIQIKITVTGNVKSFTMTTKALLGNHSSGSSTSWGAYIYSSQPGIANVPSGYKYSAIATSTPNDSGATTTWTFNNVVLTAGTWYIHFNSNSSRAYQLGYGGFSFGSVTEAVQYTISYDRNSGNSTPSSQTCWSGQSINLAAAISRSSTSASRTITYNGNNGTPGKTSDTSTTTYTYTFYRWRANSTNGTPYTAGESYSPTANVKMYATWTTGGGTFSAVTLPSATRSGYTFLGWNTSSSATSGMAAGTSYTPTGNVTLYAIWAQSSFKLTIHPNAGHVYNGTSNQTVNMTSGSSLGLYQGYKASYGWGGWYWANDGNFGGSMYENHAKNASSQWRTGAYNTVGSYAIEKYSNESSVGTFTQSYAVDNTAGTGGYVVHFVRSGATGNAANGFWGPLLKNTGYFTRNSVWIHHFRAKLPTGYYFWPRANAVGSDAEVHWLTSNAGTGGWYNYAYEYRVGTTGSFTSGNAIGYVSIQTGPNSNSPHFKGSLTFQVAYSIMFTTWQSHNWYMPAANADIYAQWYQPMFWTYQDANGGTLVDNQIVKHNYGTAYTANKPKRTNYYLENWTRIWATNLFKETWTYINMTSGNTYSVFKIQLLSSTGSYLKQIFDSGGISYTDSWTCDVATGYYFIRYGMNGSTADQTYSVMVYLENGATYGVHWDRVNNTAGQNITINNFIFGKIDTSSTTSYSSSNNYSLYLKANWRALAILLMEANGGWLVPGAYRDSWFANNYDLTTIRRLDISDFDYNQSHYGHTCVMMVAYGHSADISNYNNSSYLNLERFGYSVPDGQEWAIEHNGITTYYDQDVSYAATDWLSDVTADNTVTERVYVNWQPNNYTFTLKKNDGTSTSVVDDYGTIATLPTDTKNHYEFKGWYHYFDGTEAVQMGRDYMYTDQFAAHWSVYRDDWSNLDTSNERMLTCAYNGGWSVTYDSTHIYGNVYTLEEDDYVQATANQAITDLAPGFHDFDLVFTSSELKLYLDDTLIASAILADQAYYFVSDSSVTQLLLGSKVTQMSSSNPYGINVSNGGFTGYIGNVVIKNQATKIDSVAARTEWAMPCQDLTLVSLFEEKPHYEIVAEDLQGGKITFADGTTCNDGTTVKLYLEDLEQLSGWDGSLDYVISPAMEKMFTSITIDRAIPDLSVARTQFTTKSWSQGALIIDTQSSGINSSLPLDSTTYTEDTVFYINTTSGSIPVVRWQYQLVDNNSNQIVDNNGNTMTVALKYVPYRWNATTNTWQRCEPRGYSNNSWKEGT